MCLCVCMEKFVYTHSFTVCKCIRISGCLSPTQTPQKRSYSDYRKNTQTKPEGWKIFKKNVLNSEESRL